MRSSISLYGCVLLWIASQMLEFLEQREQRINPKIYSLPSRDKNNLQVNLKQNLQNNLQLESFSVSSVCSVDKKNCRATLHHSYISTQQNIMQGNYFIPLTTKFTRQSTNYRSLLVDFSLVPRSSLVVLSFVIRYPIEDRANNERENSEKTAK